MYVVTFYSFKGGVGRTMALVNTAVELTLRGKKVLVVDFDLEAPGIQTYEPFRDESQSRGIVDYVTDYMESGAAPDFRDYLIEKNLNGHSVWLMPAGLQDRDYARRLNSIDWLALYRDRDGYLMFEDLKQQWEEAFSFDYVLIDSRTGHTDVGGICTRQLPDANVLMFFPNDQNIMGLREVAENIRSETDRASERKIHIHFCPSNVPDLDDEDLILQRHFDRAMDRLKYKEPSSIIHHYNSLALLDQKIFVKDRKKTRLADEYRKLVDAIASENLEDRSGALSQLEKIRGTLRANRTVASSVDTQQTLDSIFGIHNSDGEVALSLAAAYYGLGNVKGELEALSIAIAQKFSEIRARIRRATLLSAKQADLAREDLRFVIASSEATIPEFVSAISRLREIDDGWLNAVANSEKINQLSAFDLSRVASVLTVDAESAFFAAKLMLKRLGESDDNIIMTDLVLALIGSGNYRKAMEVLGNDRTAIMQLDRIEPIFNFACAEWGETGEPPLDLFHRVLELGIKRTDRTKIDPNFMQCLSLASYVTGFLLDALAQLERSADAIHSAPPSEIFSCWRFFYQNKTDFADDLDRIRTQMKAGERLLPEFLQRPSLWIENLSVQ